LGKLLEHVLILGGDGYLGWPTALRLSNLGYNVTIVDNYSRRELCSSLKIHPLYPIPDLIERSKSWFSLTGNDIKVLISDLSDYSVVESLFCGSVPYTWQNSNLKFSIPSSVIHYAEQPSAPYSVKNAQASLFTLVNNLSVTNNILWAIKSHSPDTHLIKLGTMGEYGTPNIDIEEGWLDISHKGRSDRFLFPRQAGSIYHTSKIMDTDLIWYAVRVWKLKVTDLMQGPVYGLLTDEIKLDPSLKTIFNYDEIFGTVFNRFIVQAVCHHPLTVYGEGGQTRGYLNLKDTLQCVLKSIQTPASSGELRIFNQIVETFSVNDIAGLVKSVGDSRGLDVKINKIPNPRVEAESHYYNPSYQGLLDIGLEPTFLTTDVLSEIFDEVDCYRDNILSSQFIQGIKW